MLGFVFMAPKDTSLFCVNLRSHCAHRRVRNHILDLRRIITRVNASWVLLWGTDCSDWRYEEMRYSL